MVRMKSSRTIGTEGKTYVGMQGEGTMEEEEEEEEVEVEQHQVVLRNNHRW